MSSIVAKIDDSEQDLAIKVRALSKAYQVYAKPKDYVLELAGFGDRHSDFWALRDINFDIVRGEVVGVIGPNGAGKSTLLKILAGTLTPSTGSVQTVGSVSAILELGTGFNPEFTGRENIVVGGMCLGMSKNEVMGKVEQIIDFSELHDVIDRPFRTYSSGMKARLTFATSISVEPEILIIDEALAAGDAYFVHKCMGRIRDICRSGATILFVSHSSPTVERLCSRAIWMHDGMIRMEGSAMDVCSAYEHFMWSRVERENIRHNDAELKRQAEAEGKGEILGPNGTYELGGSELSITKVEVLDKENDSRTTYTQGEPMRIRIYWEGETEKRVQPSVRIDSSAGEAVTGWNGNEYDCIYDGLSGAGYFDLDIGSNLFGMGQYFISVSIAEDLIHQSEDSILSYKHRIVRFGIKRRLRRELTYAFETQGTWSLVKEPIDQNRGND